MSNPLAFATLSALSTAIQGFVEDTGAELQTDINTIIQLGEGRVATDMNLEIFDTVVTGGLTGSTRIQAIKPAGHQAMRSLHLRDVGGAGPARKLARRSYEFCIEYAPDDATEAEPVYFAEYGPTQLYVVPTPDVAYGYELRQVVAPPSLVTTAPTWMATNLGDLLLYACLVSTEEYLKADDSFVARWTQEYQGLLQLRRFELRDALRADYTPVKNAARAVGGPT